MRSCSVRKQANVSTDPASALRQRQDTLISERATPQKARSERAERAAPPASATPTTDAPEQGWSNRLWRWGQTAGTTINDTAKITGCWRKAVKT